MNSGDGDSSDGTPAGARTIRLLDNRVDSRDIFVATREITIAHGDDLYRLRLTHLLQFAQVDAA